MKREYFSSEEEDKEKEDKETTFKLVKDNMWFYGVPVKWTNDEEETRIELTRQFEKKVSMKILN